MTKAGCGVEFRGKWRDAVGKYRHRIKKAGLMGKFHVKVGTRENLLIGRVKNRDVPPKTGKYVYIF